MALVKKCGGVAPPFTEPKIFNYIVTSPLDENDLNELYVKQNGRPPKNSKGKTKKKLQTLHDDETVLQEKKKIKSNVSKKPRGRCTGFYFDLILSAKRRQEKSEEFRA